MAVFCSFQEAQFCFLVFEDIDSVSENVRDRDMWIGSDSDCLILVCARSDNSGRRLLDLLSQERALKRDESWKVFLVLYPITRDEVARADLMVVNSC